MEPNLITVSLSELLLRTEMIKLNYSGDNDCKQVPDARENKEKDRILGRVLTREMKV